MEDSTCEYWASNLLVDDRVDLSLFCRAIADALSAELKEMSPEPIFKLMLSLLEESDWHYLSTDGGQTLVEIPVVFSHFTEWAVAIGIASGWSPQDDEFADAWITDDMPRTKAVFGGLVNLVSEFMVDAGARIKAEHGYSPAEALVHSINTGESFDQSRARIVHGSKGLHLVGEKKTSQ